MSSRTPGTRPGNRQSQSARRKSRTDPVAEALDDFSMAPDALPADHDDHHALQLTPNKRGQVSLNHLINFSFPPRQNLHSSASGSASSRRRRQNIEPFNKQRFLNANFRFVLRPDKDYQVYLFDPDIIVEWEDIDQVIMPTSKDQACPICLSPPVAPRVTKCGHVYCWPCIRHYLHLGEKSWRKCPICYDSIYDRDLKSVHFSAVTEIGKPAVSAPRLVQFTLMKRVQNSTIALPKELYDAWENRFVPPVVTTESALSYAKLLVSTRAHMVAVAQSDEAALGAAIADHAQQAASYPHVAGTDSERPFLDMCMSDIRTLLLNPAERAAPATAPSLQPFMSRPSASSLLNAASASSSTDSHRDIVKLANEALAHSADAETYYFYQSADGQLLYLHPLDIKILKSAYNEYEAFPEHIEVPVLAAQESTVNMELRKKCKYLGHLPLSCDVTFCEVDLASVVPADTLDQFSRELSSRIKRLRKQQQQDDHAATQPAGHLDHQYSIESMAAGGSDTSATQRDDAQWLEGAFSASLSESGMRSLSPSIHDPPPASASPSASTSSFAKMARAAAAASSKPWTHAAPRHRHASDDELLPQDRHGWVLDFDETALLNLQSGAADAADAAAPSSSSSAAASTGGGRSKKGSKKVMLVTNGGARRRN
ncbi:hypothetical protein BC831DRAFT_458297 [Entophlyctis helioformis]|nr:hypothetical protein BC831DRAFT_458297 [Entophlyctis helioformis]